MIDVIAKEWGPDGSLHAFTDPAVTWDSLEWNGQTWVRGANPTLTPEQIDGRVLLEQVDGAAALVFRRSPGDPGWDGGSGVDRIRMEAAFSDFACQSADWVAAGETGANAAEAYRWYRWCYRIDDYDDGDFPTQWLQGSFTAYALVQQFFHRLDTNPPDTIGIPPFATHIRVNGYRRYRHCAVQSTSAASQTTTSTPEEIAAWHPPRRGWNDMVAAVRWSHTSLGELRVWRNRRPIIERIGQPNCYNNAPSRGGGGIRPKIGLYAGPWSLVQGLPLRICHRGLVVARGEYSVENFGLMHPEEPNAVPLPPSSGPVMGVAR